jgi:hypothetical protein
MAIVTGTLNAPGEDFDGALVDINIPTVRIPELPEVDLPFDATDKFPLYDSSQNKTVWVASVALLAYLNGAGATPITPVTNGSIVEITITSGMAGSYQVNVPALAGFTFELERRGEGTLKVSEYSILISGGFELTDHLDLVMEGEVFFAKVFEFMAPPDPSTLYSLLNGKATISSNTTLSSIHYNKLLHIEGGTDKIEIILPDIADAPDNLVVIIETVINNTYKTKISGNSGQNIYYGNSSNNSLYLGISEFLWLYRSADGWYVIKASHGLVAVGETLFGYKQGLNDVIADGSVINRADEPRLWAWVQTLGSSLVSDATWVSSTGNLLFGTFYHPYKGCFSTGNGTTTFRLPDMRNQFVRGLKTIGGADSERPFNGPGGLQKDEFKSHAHSQEGLSSHNSGTSGIGADSGAGQTGATGGVETRGMNVGLLPLIRT